MCRVSVRCIGESVSKPTISTIDLCSFHFSATKQESNHSEISEYPEYTNHGVPPLFTFPGLEYNNCEQMTVALTFIMILFAGVIFDRAIHGNVCCSFIWFALLTVPIASLHNFYISFKMRYFDVVE